MLSVTYLLLICLGALFILSLFHFTIYLQQQDKAFRNYALYLMVMAVFNVVRLLDKRLTNFYPLAYYDVETLDPILANLGFLMYVNFLGVILKITPAEKFYYRCWKLLQVFIISFLLVYFILRVTGDRFHLSGRIISVASFCCMGFGLLLMLRLFRYRKDAFFKLIIAGTIVSVSGVTAGLILNIFVYKDSLAFEGLYLLEASMLAETVFLSAALGYRLKMAYTDKEKFQQRLLEETQKREELAIQAAQLLKKELDVTHLQSRISKDLHDDVGSSLSSLQIYSSLAATLVDKKPEEAKKMLQQIATNTEEVMENMDHIVWAMQPHATAAHSIEARIKDIGHHLLTVKNIHCTYSIGNGVENVCNSMELRKNIILIAKEAVNNIAKYSNTSKAAISLTANDGCVILNISDNGDGFNLHNYQPGNGIKNMRARAAALCGTACITSVPGGGTTVTCTIPIAIISDIKLPQF